MKKNSKKSKIKRIWHDYRKWEGWKNGMYLEMKDEMKDTRISQSACLLKSPIALLISMTEVINEWIYESEQFMSHASSNRQAWLGQAACNYNHFATESETRKAWNTLTTEEMEQANNIADAVIEEWEKRYENEIRHKYISSGTRKDTFYL